jgi:membrane-bound lytic murein transglycosylase D
MTILSAKPIVFSAVAGSFLFLIHIPLFSQNLDIVQHNTALPTEINSSSLPTAIDTLILPEECMEPLPSMRTEIKKEVKACLPPISPLRKNKITNRLLTVFKGRESHFITAMLQQRSHFFPIYEHYLKQYGLPDELKYVSVIESALKVSAKSRCKALGLWQFMPATGRQYQLYQDAYIDERLDPYKATEAACRYLKDLYDRFGNWELALAAYNCGPGNVRKAIRRSGNQTSFWKIAPYLPSETRTYVPKFAVVHHLMTRPLSDTLFENFFSESHSFDTIRVTQYVDIKRLALQLDIPYNQLVTLNPQIKRHMIPAYPKGYTLKIPAGKKAYFDLYRSTILANIGTIHKTPELNGSTNHAAQRRQKIVHRVGKGQVLGNIAARYQVKVSDIRRWNGLRTQLIKSGQRLIIWKKDKRVFKAALSEEATTSAGSKVL